MINNFIKVVWSLVDDCSVYNHCTVGIGALLLGEERLIETQRLFVA